MLPVSLLIGLYGEASKEVSVCHSTIQSVASHDGYHKTAKGCGWIYLDEYDPNRDNRIVKHLDHNTKKVYKIDLKSNEIIDSYDSIKEASIKNGYPLSNYIGDVCNGYRQSYKGFGWKFMT